MGIHRGVGSSPERILRPEHPERRRRKVRNRKGAVRIWNEPLTAPKQPIPSTLPLLATGLVALGMLGWRIRRQRNGAPLLAAA